MSQHHGSPRHNGITSSVPVYSSIVESFFQFRTSTYQYFLKSESSKDSSYNINKSVILFYNCFPPMDSFSLLYLIMVFNSLKRQNSRFMDKSYSVGGLSFQHHGSPRHNGITFYVPFYSSIVESIFQFRTSAYQYFFLI